MNGDANCSPAAYVNMELGAILAGHKRIVRFDRNREIFVLVVACREYSFLSQSVSLSRGPLSNEVFPERTDFNR